MTTNDILLGVAEAIHTEFGAEYRIYTEPVRQNLSAPCFRIRTLNTGLTASTGRRRAMSLLISVQYFPRLPDSESECGAVLDRLLPILLRIRAADGSVLHGDEPQGQLTDGVLTVTVSFPSFILTPEAAADNMAELTIEPIEGKER